MTKKCFKCNKIKDKELFYKHPQTADGLLNKCITCTRRDVKERYYDPIARQKIVDYEKNRAKDPRRIKNRLLYQRRLRLKSPGKYMARQKVTHAIRSGRLKPLPCEVCGNTKTEAHHKDYRKYLDVSWLCRTHHMEIENKIPF